MVSRLPDRDAPDQRRVAVVSGGAGAIGGAICRSLEESGHRTVVIDRTGTIPCDLGSESSTRDAAAAVLVQYGRCDVFVQSAAAFDQVALEELDATTLRCRRRSGGAFRSSLIAAFRSECRCATLGT